MFYAAEAIRRKPVGPRATEWAYRTGIALVLTLMVVVTVNDVFVATPVRQLTRRGCSSSVCVESGPHGAQMLGHAG